MLYPVELGMRYLRIGVRVTTTRLLPKLHRCFTLSLRVINIYRPTITRLVVYITTVDVNTTKIIAAGRSDFGNQVLMCWSFYVLAGKR